MKGKSYTLEASFALFKSSKIPTNVFFPTCLNKENLTNMKWEQSKMAIPMCFTVLLTIAALSATHYSPYSGVKRSGEAASNTTSHTAFLRGISLTMAKAL